MKARICRIFSLFLCVTFSIASMVTAQGTETDADNAGAQVREGSYEAYIAQHDDKQAGKSEVIIETAQVSRKPEGAEIRKDYKDKGGDSLFTPDEGTTEWAFNASEGFYYLVVEYYPEKSKAVAAERTLKINNELPFDDAAYLTFNRVWADQGEPKLDIYGNQIRPKQVEAPRWMTTYVYDSLGYYSEPLKFYIKEGTNTLSLEAVKEPMTIRRLRLVPANPIPSYKEKIKEYGLKGYTGSTDYLEIVEAEDTLYKSNQTLYPYADMSSASTQPYRPLKQTINAVGSRWKNPQQFLAWQITVPKDGLYKIALKVRKNTSKGMLSTRRLTVDGQIPFQEAYQMGFKFSNDWTMVELGNGNDPYLFYLTAGTHELQMETSLGSLGAVLKSVEDTMLRINRIYRDFLMITGADPDKMRDYKLKQLLPEDITDLAVQAGRLEEAAASIFEKTGQKGSDLASLETLAKLMRSCSESPASIPKSMKLLKTYIGSVGTWLNNVRLQPLELDYIAVASPDKVLPKAKKGFLADITHDITAFIGTFILDYNSIGSMTETPEEAIRVWIPTGRDQLQILRNMTNDMFTAETGIAVNLELVNANSLLPATVAGIGADVALSMGQGEPVNYALRNAAADISKMDGYDEVVKRFSSEAMVPFQFNGGSYALPETQFTPVLFYRKDILDELGIKPPETWEDLIAAITVLKKNNLDFSMPVPNTASAGSFYMFLMQNGGNVYTDDEMSSLLDSKQSVEAFKKYTNFYVNHKLLLEFDFPNRFRTGEMPMGIADYTLYNTLVVSAPEIRGLWDFTLVPGTKKSDGTVDHTTTLALTSCFILEQSKKKQAAWEFLKWWTSADAQSRFGSEIESVLGASARYPTANLEAFEQLPWSAKELKSLNEQFKWARAVKEIPGGYFVSRHINNAFRAVAQQKADAKETLLDYANIINQEITSKRKEFQLPVRQSSGEGEKDGSTN